MFDSCVMESCFLLIAELQLSQPDCSVPEADFLHFSRPAGRSQSYLISQNKSSSPLLWRASQTGQPG